MPDRRDDRPPRSEERNTLEDDKDSAAVMMSLITTVSEVGQSRGVLTKRGKGDATAATAEISEGPKDGSIVTSAVFLSPFFSFPLFFFFFPSEF